MVQIHIGGGWSARVGRSARVRGAISVLGALALGLAFVVPAGASTQASTAAAPGATPAAQSAPQVLRVGTYHGIPGQFGSIQAAVNASHPGDWILVAPGDYHERGDYAAAAAHGGVADQNWGGVELSTPNIHVRGMDRNTTVVDGTAPGAPQCSAAASDQTSGPPLANGRPAGRNGIEIWKADGVSVENMTVCNFLSVAGGGNEVWWNGGDGSGHIGMGSYYGAYLTTSSTFYGGDGAPMAQYGIFSSDASGPGLWAHTYASNMADSGYYIGACPDCNAAIIDGHAQNSALGYSGTNSGGRLLIALSEFDHNKTGISSNSQNNDDQPSPQDGSCPNGNLGILGTGSCTFFAFNNIHDNNNPNVPGSGTAELGPVGTGVVLAGGRHDTLAFNRVTNNGAWGLLLVPYPDSETPPSIADCGGGVKNPGGLLGSLGVTCYFDDFGNQVSWNSMSGNGTFGNVGNGDLADVSGQNTPGNCWFGNVDPKGITESPANLQETHSQCGVANSGNDITSPTALQVICDTEIFGSCTTSNYPRRTTVTMAPIPSQATMPNPCAGVPSNPWCSRPWWWPWVGGLSAGGGGAPTAGASALVAKAPSAPSTRV